MLLQGNLDQNNEIFAEQACERTVQNDVEILLQKYERLQIKLSVIADEVPSDDFDVDALIKRERKLFAQKDDILGELSQVNTASELNAKAIFQILKAEAEADGCRGIVMMNGRAYESYKDLMDSQFC